MVFMVTSTAMACGCGCSKEKGGSCASCQAKTSGGHFGPDHVCSETVENVKNTVCPVSGKPIGSMGKGVSQIYQGKVYQLCCAGCVEKFKAKPEKYIRKIKIKQ